MISSKSEKGTIKKTNYQVKKYFTSMTPKEKTNIINYVKGIDINKISLSSHIHREFKMEDIRDILNDVKTSNIIEFNKNLLHNDKRVVLKGDKKIKMMFNNKVRYCYLHIVLSLTTKRIVTLWYNDIHDNHKTLDMSRYSNFKIEL